MIPVKQNNRHRPAEGLWGDCHSAAIASVLELSIDEVPNFGDGGPDGEEFVRRINEWLASRGLVQITVAYTGDDLDKVLAAVASMNPGLYYLLGGESRRGVDHTVVCLNDKIVWDPHPDNCGIVGPLMDEGLYQITFFGSLIAKKKDKTI